jgi:hypothetical protein
MVERRFLGGLIELEIAYREVMAMDTMSPTIRCRRNIQSAWRSLRHEKIQEHVRADDANAVELFQIEQV